VHTVEEKSDLRKRISPVVLILVAIAIAIVGTILVVDWHVQQQESTGEASQPAPKFALQDYNGNTIRLSDSHGTVRIVNSWATWCPFCVDELPDFAHLQEEFGKEITVVAINRQESAERAKEYTDELHVTEQLVFLLDPTDTFYKQAGGFGMPVTLFIDREGNTILIKRGFMTLEEMREKVLEILQTNT